MRKGAGVIRIMAYIMLSGGLLMASWMDRKECLVYNYVWWWCLPWACLLALSEGWDIRTWIAAAGFAALQQLVFGHMYGRADCHAFQCVLWRNVPGIQESYGPCAICCWRCCCLRWYSCFTEMLREKGNCGFRSRLFLILQFLSGWLRCYDIS